MPYNYARGRSLENRRESDKVRIRSGQLPASFVLTALLYLLAGPAALLFALMLPAAAISRRESLLPALVATATSLLLPLLPFLAGSTAQPELLPSFYYEPTGGMPPFIILCHFSIPLPDFINASPIFV